MPRAVHEEPIAAALVAHLRAQEWTVFAEVETPVGRCDIVARRGAGTILAVEAKVDIGWDVICQAARWREGAHYVSVVTQPRKRGAAHDIAVEILTALRIGWTTIDRHGVVREVVKAPPQRLPAHAWLEDFLRDEQQHFAPAGNANGARFSPHAQTIRDLVAYVREHPRCSLEDAVAAGVTHYRSEQEARRLVPLIRKGKLGALRVKHDGCRFRLYVDDDAPAESETAPPKLRLTEQGSTP